MRLNLLGHGTLWINCDWSGRGVTQAFPFIQQLFKRWNGWLITLTEAVNSIKARSSHQKPDFNTLFKTYLAFVPNAGDTMWQSNDLPVQKTCTTACKNCPPVHGAALVTQCLAQWDQGSCMRQAFGQTLYGFLNWAVHCGHLNPM